MHHAYRGVIGTIGVATIVLALAIGWLPGPGGVPLALVGLAILASEFVWAHDMLGRARRSARDLARWTTAQPRVVRQGLGLATAGGVLVGLWLILLIAGVPPWLPQWLIALLDAVPGLRPA